jgi:hypothetical protein
LAKKDVGRGLRLKPTASSQGIGQERRFLKSGTFPTGLGLRPFSTKFPAKTGSQSNRQPRIGERDTGLIPLSTQMLKCVFQQKPK